MFSKSTTEFYRASPASHLERRTAASLGWEASAETFYFKSGDEAGKLRAKANADRRARFWQSKTGLDFEANLGACL